MRRRASQAISGCHRRAATLLTALVPAAALAGCGLGAGRTPASVTLLVTRDFGAQTVRSLPHPRSAGEETVMALLERNAAVATRYGGGFVESVDGQAGGYAHGQPVDWFYYLNGVQADRGAAQTNVRSGDRVWWDLHDWSQTDEVPAVVGSFPEPFLHGVEGRVPHVRVECASPQMQSCLIAERLLRAAGVRDTTTQLGDATPPGSTLRVLVGTWRELEGQDAARLVEGGPGVSGVYARVLARGRRIALLDGHGASTDTLGPGSGLVAAIRRGSSEPEWLVTGTNAAGVNLAAQSLREAALRGSFAVAVIAKGVAGTPETLPLPRPGPTT